MKVLKFGGTSIGNANQIRKSVNIILDNEYKIVVFSAIQNITNLLSDFIQQSKKGNWIISEQILHIIKDTHLGIINDLLSGNKFKEIAIKKLNDTIVNLSKYHDQKIKDQDEGIILAQGELLSTMIIFLYLLDLGKDAVLLPALSFIKLNKNGDPDYDHIEQKLQNEVTSHKGCKTFITQGFICKNHKNNTDNLGRGGSDFTATIIGSALKAEIVEIWTDTDGIQNNDPRFVQNTQAIHEISYDLANELAYFGAKILHPASINPAENYDIPISVKNTLNPEAVGTLISHKKDNSVNAIAAKDGITTVKIKSARMMNAYGFLRRIFEVFEKYQTSVDMLTTSEISVAMTIDNVRYLNEITQDLSNLGEVEVETNQCIICIVGDYSEKQNISIQNIMNSLNNIPIKMISFGASQINISLVINSNDKMDTLNILNSQILKNESCLTIQE